MPTLNIAPAGAARLAKLTAMMVHWIDEDWDQPLVHQMRAALGLPEGVQEDAAALMRHDLEALGTFLLEKKGGAA